MIAAEQGNLEIVKELIKNGANCNLEDLVCIKIIYSFLVFFFSLVYIFVLKE
jgi:ankyrin repeat protein